MAAETSLGKRMAIGMGALTVTAACGMYLYHAWGFSGRPDEGDEGEGMEAEIEAIPDVETFASSTLPHPANNLALGAPTTTYIAHTRAAADALIAAAGLASAEALGMDMEWQPGSGSPVALVQLATRHKAFLFPLVEYTEEVGGGREVVPQALQDLLGDKGVLKVGVGVAGDVKRLRASFGVAMLGSLDLQALASGYGLIHGGMGLKRMVEAFVAPHTLAKPHAVQCSDWSVFPYTPQQIGYAATDALAGILILDALLTRIEIAGEGHGMGVKSVADVCGRWVDRKLHLRSLPSAESGGGGGKKGKKRKKKVGAGAKDGVEEDADGDDGEKGYQYATRDRPLYDNCRILAPDGETFLCYCSHRKLVWYLERDLATQKEGEERTIILKFEPAGSGNNGDAFYSAPKKNECVVCGATDALCRFHVIPSMYRKFYPKDLKSHSSHDVVLLCQYHIRPSNDAMTLLAEDIAAEFGVPLAGLGERQIVDTNLKAIVDAARVLLRNRSGSITLPEAREAEIRSGLASRLGVDESEIDLESAVRTKYRADNPDWKPHGLVVVSSVVESGQAGGLSVADALHPFTVRFRAHFVEEMNPQYLAEGWSVDHRDLE